ncbi:hypothetical protein [Pseudomonas sp. PDM19]|uniref:hypothetical protein n=1 Tax=Pseudomonas sp. PDM19 TaxID=2769272 RepID=UPI0017833775|nr:hypothetical protein [Pseudomonas sp. PDM19]MBD9630634.1 hypothetical protein [Pseudomonas sp. PDM19]
MIGLVYILFFAVYLVLFVIVVSLSYRFSKRRFKKGWAGAWVSAAIMFGIVFWDWIPVYVLHKYYCSSEAGFWLYKSPQQWVKNNPGEIGKKWGSEYGRKSETLSPNTRRYWYSDRIYVDVTQGRFFFDELGGIERVLVDSGSGDVLARGREFGRGNPAALSLGARNLSDYKIWLSLGRYNCGPIENPAGFMDQFSKNVYALGELVKKYK